MDGHRELAYRRTTRAAIMVLVVTLHLIAYWATSRINLPVASKPTELEWVFISPPRVVKPIQTNPADVTLSSRATALVPKPPQAPQSLEIVPTLPDDQSRNPHAPTPTTDWNSELERAAKNAAAAEGSPQNRAFGFPQRAATAPKVPPFEWDPTHGRKVEFLPGGVLVHLGDNCVLVFSPFPQVGCHLGKRQANGHLLDHMKDDASGAGVPAP